MAIDVEERYSLENGLPDNKVTPKYVEEFYQKYERYPAKVVVNLKHKVTWSEYLIPIPIPLRPSKPLEKNKDIDDTETPMVQFYCIAIEYDNEVDEKALVCRGFAKTL